MLFSLVDRGYISHLPNRHLIIRRPKFKNDFLHGQLLIYGPSKGIQTVQIYMNQSWTWKLYNYQHGLKVFNPFTVNKTMNTI